MTTLLFRLSVDAFIEVVTLRALHSSPDLLSNFYRCGKLLGLFYKTTKTQVVLVVRNPLHGKS